MSNFPSKWFDFTTNKEIKRIRKDINSTLALKIEISSSIILTIIAFCFSEYIHMLRLVWQVCICIAICFIVFLIFFTSYILKWVSIKRNGNVIVQGRDAVTIFDDEIVYNVLAAAEYYNSIEQIKDNKIKNDLIAFYNIEIEYYLSKAVNELLKFNTNYSKIFGYEKSQISLVRLKNILDLINSIKNSSSIKFEKTTECAFNGLYQYFFK